MRTVGAMTIDGTGIAPRDAVDPDADSAGLRERKKDATRRALAERALELAVERGYHGFTIADLVAAVGVSRRTFSNYFTGKADCISAVTDGWLDDVLDAIREADGDASLFDVMRTGLMAVAHQGTERWGALESLIDAEPELAARALARDEDVAELVCTEVAARTGRDTNDIRVRLLASYAVTAGREVMSRWTSSDSSRSNEELARLLEAAFSILDPTALLLAPAPTTSSTP